jgi:hypothetical protein
MIEDHLGWILPLEDHGSPGKTIAVLAKADIDRAVKHLGGNESHYRPSVSRAQAEQIRRVVSSIIHGPKGHQMVIRSKLWRLVARGRGLANVHVNKRGDDGI